MQMAPPQVPPRVTLGEGDGLHSVRFRLWQLLWTAATVGVTAWICTFGWIPAILALLDGQARPRRHFRHGHRRGREAARLK